MRFFITKTLFYLKKCYLFKIMLEPFLSYHRKLVIAEEKVKFLENSDVVFNTVIQLLKKNGIHVWLDFGTLLGAYRDSDFIKNDFDMDFGAFGTDYDKIKTLMQDPVYRSGVAAEQTAYNQPPHVGFYMGQEVFETRTL